MAQNGFVSGGAEVGQALRDAAEAIGQGETVVKEVEGGFEAPNAVIDYYAKLTVSPKEGEQPTEPGTEPTPGEPPVVDNTLPEGPPYPDNTLPNPEPQPEPEPGEPPVVDNTLPEGPPYPDNSLPNPEPQPEPEPGEPGSPPYVDNTLPGDLPYPDNSLPGEQPEIDNSLPGPGSAGGEHPDNTLPEPEPQPEPEPGEPENPLEPAGEIPDESWTVQEIKDWAKDNDIELSTGMRKDDILVVIRNETGQQ